MEGVPIVISIDIILMILICLMSWLVSEDVQDWLQIKYYKFRMWRIKRKNKKNEWKWGDEIKWQ